MIEEDREHKQPDDQEEHATRRWNMTEKEREIEQEENLCSRVRRWNNMTPEHHRLV